MKIFQDGSRAEVASGRNNIVIEALDDRGMTVEINFPLFVTGASPS